jgi:5-methylcytosine-specific restriction protein A
MPTYEKSKRNAKWNRDEIILALDLYFKITPGQIHSSNPEVLALSVLINKLPSFEEKADQERYRNANGVSLKLSNFLAIDDSQRQKGMQSFSILDQAIFNEFKDRKEILKSIANNIRAASNDPEINRVLNKIDTEIQDEYEAPEGRVLYKLHSYKERNSTLVKKKKLNHFNKFGNLACELCGFDYERIYGSVGRGFAECHHRSPLHLLKIETVTKLEDLIIVCANCHRMVHRGWAP